MVTHQDAPPWTVSRWHVIVGGGLILTQACLTAVLLLQRTSRRRAEQSLTERLRFERCCPSSPRDWFPSR